MSLLDDARQAYRDYVTDGVPASGPHNPVKSDIRDVWATAYALIQGLIEGSGAGAVVAGTRAGLYGDLAHDEGVMGWVMADDTPAYNGIYRKSGASGAGSWVYVTEFSFQSAVDAAKNAALSAVTTQQTTSVGAVVTQQGLSTTAVDAAGGNQISAIAAAVAAKFLLLNDTGYLKIYGSTADALSNGVIGTTSLVGGSGGTNGTFDLAFSGGAGSNAAGRFTVAGGAVVSIVITNPGKNYTSAPTISFAASSGLTGASATAQIGANRSVGQYFSVPVSASNDAFIHYRVDTGPVATEVMRSPSITSLAEITDVTDAPQTVRMPRADVGASNKVTSIIQPTGVHRFATISARTLNGRRPENDMLGQKPSAGAYLDRHIFMTIMGQSLAEQHVGGGNITIAQEYSTTAFPYGVSDTAQIVPAVATTEALIRSGQSGGATRWGENPMYGMAGFFWELLAKENGITPADVGMRVCVANNARSATGITSLDKPSAYYDAAIAQAAALVATPPATGQRWRCFGTGWFQGESDTGLASYKTTLQTLVKDFTADIRAAMTAQTFDPLFVVGQPTSDGQESDRSTVIRQIFSAVCDAEDGIIPAGHSQVPPIKFACPNYFMDFRYDTTSGVHVKARDSKWLGAYVALVFKRILVDAGTFKTIRPIKLEIENGAVFLKFQMRAPGTKLVVAECAANRAQWDGVAIPQQAGRGFRAVDGSAAAITWSQLPDVVAPDTIRLIPSVAPSNIARIDYGQQAPSYMHPFTGNAGNFRDNYGDFVFYDAIKRPMHNWMPIFSVAPAVNSAGFTLS